MNTANDSTRLADDLAAHWTDPALEILKAAGVDVVSVDMELETWQTLMQILQAELRWQRAFRLATRVSLSMLMEQVLRKTTLLVARKFAAQAVSAEFMNRLQRLVHDRRTTAAELGLYAALVRQLGLRAAFKPPSRTDYVPRLQLSPLPVLRERGRG